jgi:hypothetical protein
MGNNQIWSDSRAQRFITGGAKDFDPKRNMLLLQTAQGARSRQKDFSSVRFLFAIMLKCQ